MHALLDPGFALLLCLSVQASERHIARFFNKQVCCGLTGVLGLRSHIQLGSLSSRCSPISFRSPPRSTKYTSLFIRQHEELRKGVWSRLYGDQTVASMGRRTGDMENTDLAPLLSPQWARK